MSRTVRAPLPLLASLSVSLLLAACGSGSDSSAKAAAKPATAKPATKSDSSEVAKDAAVEAAAGKAAHQEATAPKSGKPADAAAPAAKPADAAAAGVAATPGAPGDAVAQVDAFIAGKKIDKTKTSWKTSLPKPELVSFDASKSYFWELKTNKGDMRFKYMPDVAPMHVTNSIYLTRLGFYDGVPFHRVMKDFMAQGGDPLGNGSGGPGYAFGIEVKPTVKHDKPGVLSTANTGRPNSDGSQFFIMFKENTGLDGKYSIYGQLVSGQDTLKAMEAVANPGDGPPREKLIIEKASISVE